MSFHVPLKRSVSNLSFQNKVKERIKSMKNLTGKITCTCGEEFTKKGIIPFKIEDRFRLVYAIQNSVDSLDVDRMVESMVDLFENYERNRLGQ